MVPAWTIEVIVIPSHDDDSPLKEGMRLLAESFAEHILEEARAEVMARRSGSKLISPTLPLPESDVEAVTQ